MQVEKDPSPSILGVNNRAIPLTVVKSKPDRLPCTGFTRIGIVIGSLCSTLLSLISEFYGRLLGT